MSDKKISDLTLATPSVDSVVPCSNAGGTATNKVTIQSILDLAEPNPNALAWTSVPASATAAGTAGQVAYDGSYFYVCTATNTWVRYSGATWTNFTPASVTGLQLWLDASDSSTLYDATSGGSLVAADGAVARWEDKSGNNRHATQSTSGSRPVRKTAVQGGKDVLRFDGTNDWLDISSALLGTGTQPVTVIASIKLASLPGGGELIEIGPNPRQASPEAPNGYQFVPCADGSNTAMYLGNIGGNNDRYTANGTISASVSYVLSFVVAGSAFSSSNPKFFRNGQQQASTQGSGTSTPNLVSGQVARIAANLGGTPGQFLAADIGEMCVYNAALSDTDRAAVESYLMTKWGIS